MPRLFALVTGSLVPARLDPRNDDFTKRDADILKRMRLDETRQRLAQNRQDATRLLRQSVKAQTKRIAAGAWD